MVRERMQRVTKARPCPICGKPDWCLAAEDGSAAICARIADGSVKKCGDAGYLHILEDRHDRHDRHRCDARKRHVLTVAHGQESQTQVFEQMCAQHQRQLTSERLYAHARLLGVTVLSLQRLWLGWDGSAWTFPMSSDCGKIIGIRRRFPNGRKMSVTGSRTGLFIPVGLAGRGPLLLCEGPTDTAAALDLGYDAVGRPNCNALVQMTVKVAKGRNEIVIVADNDTPGRTGAQKLADALVLHCPTVKVVVPPDGIKDLRQWLNGGLTTGTLRETISAAAVVRLTVQLCCIDADKEVPR